MQYLMRPGHLTLPGVYPDVLRSILERGRRVSPRGKDTLELLGASFTVGDASANIIASPARRLNHHFSVAEWLWILLGQRDVRTIAYFNKNIAPFSDDGETFYGAYGPWVVAQLPYVVRTLTEDPDSRQAVMTIWQQSPPKTKDVPCTVALQFLVRDGAVHCVGTMRSNDAWLGLPYDVFNFTRIQAHVAASLGLAVGSYTHQAASLHLYASNFEGAETVIGENDTRAPKSPALTPMPVGLLPAFRRLADPATAWSIDPAAFPAPWDGYVALLKHRTTKDDAILSEPYKTLISERTR